MKAGFDISFKPSAMSKPCYIRIQRSFEPLRMATVSIGMTANIFSLDRDESKMSFCEVRVTLLKTTTMDRQTHVQYESLCLRAMLMDCGSMEHFVSVIY
jgi:hypothetical protein